MHISCFGLSEQIIYRHMTQSTSSVNMLCEVMQFLYQEVTDQHKVGHLIRPSLYLIKKHNLSRKIRKTLGRVLD